MKFMIRILRDFSLKLYTTPLFYPVKTVQTLQKKRTGENGSFQCHPGDDISDCILTVGRRL